MQDSSNITDAQFELLQVLNDLDVDDRVFILSHKNGNPGSITTLQVETHFYLSQGELDEMIANDWVSIDESGKVEALNDGGCVWVSESNLRNSLQANLKPLSPGEWLYFGAFTKEETFPHVLFFYESGAKQWVDNNPAFNFEIRSLLLKDGKVYPSLSQQMMYNALKQISAWLVCAAIETPENMAKSFPDMLEIAENATKEVGEDQYFTQVCPCTLADEPCHPRCTCIMPVSSSGCLCCASYGSEWQRQSAANKIVNVLSPNRSRYDELRETHDALTQPAISKQQAEIKACQQDNENLRSKVKRLEEEIIALKVQLEREALEQISCWSEKIQMIVETRVRTERENDDIKELNKELQKEIDDLRNEKETALATVDRYVVDVAKGKAEIACLRKSEEVWKKDVSQIIAELPENTACDPIYQRVRHLRIDHDALDYEVRLLRDRVKEEYWVWQGDGTDYPESLTCPVIISAFDLRKLLKLDVKHEAIEECKKIVLKLNPSKPLYPDMDREDIDKLGARNQQSLIIIDAFEKLMRGEN